LRRADGHRGAAQGAVIVYVGPHRPAVRGTLLIPRASVTRFGCRPCPEAGLSLHRVWKLWSFLSVELWHRVWIDGDGGGKDVASRIPEIRHELRGVHGMVGRMVHGREVRFPAIGGMAGLAQMLSVLQKGSPPARGPWLGARCGPSPLLSGVPSKASCLDGVYWR